MDYISRYDIYEDVSNFQLLPKLPVVIKVGGRGFKTLTKSLERPYDLNLINVFKNTLLSTIQNIDGAVFGFQYSDSFIFILRNDRSFEDIPWYQNKIQEITGIISSIVSVNFFKNIVLEDNLSGLDGDAIFKSKVFLLPSLNEVVNYLIWHQHLCMGDAIFRAAQTEITNLYGKLEASKILNNKKLDEKLDILQEKCQIDYETHYPASYRHGIAAYKTPKLISTIEGNIQKTKWTTNSNLPNFNKDKNFITNIIQTGVDIVRGERDIIL